MKKIIVAVDGPAGSGKSSVCKKAAALTGLRYIDSGALYRTITYLSIESSANSPGDTSYEKLLENAEVEQVFTDDLNVVSYLNGKDVSGLIRDEKITAEIGRVSDSVSVRNFVNKLLRKWAEESSVIMDGRDIGSVVFPDAELKVYLDASVDVRADRRIKEYKEMGKTLDEISVKNQIIQRDKQDMSREFGRLQRVPDAVCIDTSDYNFDEVVDKLKALIENSKSASH